MQHGTFQCRPGGITPEIVDFTWVFNQIKQLTLITLAIDGDLVARIHVACDVWHGGVVSVLADREIARLRDQPRPNVKL